MVWFFGTYANVGEELNVVITQACMADSGNAAIVFGLLRMLESALGELDVTIFDDAPGVAERLYPEFQFERLVWHDATTEEGHSAIGKAAELFAQGHETLARALVGGDTHRALHAYAVADLVVWSGGTYLVERYDLEPRFFELDLCEAFDLPLIVGAQSGGPFRKPRTRERIAELGRRASCIVARDERTFDHFLEAGVGEESLSLAADAAFALESPTATERDPQRVIFAVRRPTDDIGRFDRYVASHVEAVRRLVEERGATVTFLSTCQGARGYDVDDSKTARLIYRKLSDEVRDRVVVDADFHRPREITDKYGEAALAVATPMQAAILALHASTAVLPIAREFAMRELFRRLGQPSLVQPLSTIEPDFFGDRVIAAFDDADELRAQQRSVVGELRDAARSVADSLTGR